MMFFSGQSLSNEETKISWRVCLISCCGNFVAVADMVKALNSDNICKPFVLAKKDLTRKVSSLKLTVKNQFDLPAEMTFSDEYLRKLGKTKWLGKRDGKWLSIKHLCSDELIQQYLFGKGIGAEINATINQFDAVWSSKGAYFNAINRYITFGLTVNALLPFGLKNTGSNFLQFEDSTAPVVKRGRGGRKNENCRSKTRGITELDKKISLRF